MEKDQRNELRQIFEPIIQDTDALKSIIVYGSAVRKTRVEGSDIDIMIILDDLHEEFNQLQFHRTYKKIKALEDEEKDLKLHIQPPKKLTHWWKLLLQGEPWATTSLKYSQPIYDPDGLVNTLNKLISTSEPYQKEERSLKLLNRARENIDEAENEVKEDALHHMVDGMEEASQAVLRFRGKNDVPKEEVTDQLRSEFEGKILDQDKIEFYNKILEVERKVSNGEREIFGEELDSYKEEALNFIESLATCFYSAAEQKQRDVAMKCYDEAIKLCKKAIEENGLQAESDDEVIETFREEFVETGMVSKEYFKMLEKLKEEKNEAEIDEVSQLEIYRPIVQLKDFETAMRNSIDRDIRSLKEYNDKVQIEPVRAFQEKILKESSNIKALWILTIENILETDNITLVVLRDDLNTGEKSDLSDRADLIEEDIRSEYNFNINTRILELSDYWSRIQNADTDTLSELSEAIPIYDPEGLVIPLKKLVEEGEIKNTIKAMSEQILESPKKVVEPSEQSKSQALQKLYNASVELGQASLLTVNISPPVQKKVPQKMREHLVSESHLITEEDVKKAEEAINYWKDYEHGEVEEIEGQKLDELEKDLKELSKVVEDLVKTA